MVRSPPRRPPRRTVRRYGTAGRRRGSNFSAAGSEPFAAKMNLSLWRRSPGPAGPGARRPPVTAPAAPVPPSASALVRGLMRESATVSYSAEALRGAWDYPLVSREQEVNRPAQHISK